LKASTVFFRAVATRLGVQIFGSVASSRSRLHAAMRIPRQSRCTAAIWIIAAENASKRLAGGRNPRSTISGTSPRGGWRQRSPRHQWHPLEQDLPEA